VVLQAGDTWSLSGRRSPKSSGGLRWGRDRGEIVDAQHAARVGACSAGFSVSEPQARPAGPDVAADHHEARRIIQLDAICVHLRESSCYLR
jgi:hypothetical protein